MSLVTTPFHNAGIEFKAQYRLGQPENEGHIRRVYPNFVTDYMKNSSLIIVFTHSYYHKMRKDHLTTEIGRSLFATVHGVRYIEWTLHVKKIEREFSIELVRHTNANIKGEFRIQFSAQSKTGKKIQSFSAKWHALEHRVEYVPEYTDKLTELYENDEFNPGLLKIEVKVAFALVDFLYTKPEIEPKLNLMEEENDERIAALTLANDDSHDSLFKITCQDSTLLYDRYCLYVSCSYFHQYMDTNPERSSACLDYKSRIVDQVLIFAFSGICEVKYSGGDFQSRDFNDFREFLSCLNLLKPLMYKELLQTYDESYCHKFQNLCNTSRPPCEANTIQFLRLAVRWGFRRLEACTIARIVDIFSKTYYLHLNVDEQPHVVQELIKYQLNYEMDCEEEDKWMVEELSPLEGIELLKAKCKQVSKWIGEGFKTDLPEPKTPPLPVEPRESAYDKYRRDISAYRRSQQRQT